MAACRKRPFDEIEMPASEQEASGSESLQSHHG